MQDITQSILELIRLTSTDLPPDVEKKLKEAIKQEEPASPAREAMDTILENIRLAREGSTPVCQDTGTPIFYVHYPNGWRQRDLSEQIRKAVIEATRLTYLRPNSVSTASGKNTGDNSGDEHYPSLHFEEIEGDTLIIDLMLKGGGCENVGAQYRLPDSQIGAGRDLEGVRKCVLDAVFQAQGKGCAPGILGVAIGGDRGTSYLASKEALWRKLDDDNPIPTLDQLEKRLTEEANQLGIGPMGFGGKTTVLGMKIKAINRIPACFFVSVSYMCWAYRRRRMLWKSGKAQYE